MRKNIYSVGQVNTYIQNMFAQDFMLHQISIKGEVSNCKYHSSGHIYFTLKDQTGTIAAVMFSRYRRGLAFQMKEGDKVVVTGSVEVYERDGKYQLYAREIELEGAGNLYLKYEALKRELEEMGMFDAAYKKPIPRYATRIGIVTAPTGAAIQDIRNIAARRNPYVHHRHSRRLFQERRHHHHRRKNRPRKCHGHDRPVARGRKVQILSLCF